ncbi:smoothelin-like 1 [Salminus brasiliensis]|uniref:smoothelin-like 1 n=1 Tax=Salminus brasiliensis TaxID=930266 RepID=UPI003B839287
MENFTVPSGTEESKNQDATGQLPEEESHSGPVGVASESTGGTNEENGEEEPNPQAGASEERAEVTEPNHAKEGEKDINKEGVKETFSEEETKESESSEDADIEKEKKTHKDEAGEEKEVTEKEGDVVMEEEGKVKAESDSVKEEKTKKEEKNTHEKDKDSKCPARETVDKETKTNKKGEVQTNKEKPRDKQEKIKGKSGSTPSSSSPRTSLLTSSRPRSARPSARKEAMAKFQQDQTPVVRNFKVQKTSVGLPGGASIKQKILHWCSNKTRDYEGISIENFSSSWSDGLAFCALVHRFFPSAFDFSSLKASEREKNFTLAFSTAETLADCCPLLDVSDMLLMGNKPDPFSVFTYVQSLCQHLSKIELKRKEEAKAKEGKNQGETEGQEPSEDREQEKRAEEEQVVEKEEGERDLGEEKGGPEEEGPKMEMDQNDNVVISEKASEA